MLTKPLNLSRASEILTKLRGHSWFEEHGRADAACGTRLREVVIREYKVPQKVGGQLLIETVQEVSER